MPLLNALFSFSIDSRLLTALQKILPLDVFVETGTFHGDSVQVAKPYFKQIYSIEFSLEYYQEAQRKYQDDLSVSIINGDSGLVLADLMTKLKTRATVFWLDTHSGMRVKNTEKSTHCVLLTELKAIVHLNEDSLIIVNDARSFLSTPQASHEISRWPSFNEVSSALQALSQVHDIIIINDCLLFFPKKVEADLQFFAHQYGENWLTALEISRDYDNLMKQINEKEESIKILKEACDERVIQLQQKEQVIESLKKSHEDLKKLLLDKNTNLHREMDYQENILKIVDWQEQAFHNFNAIKADLEHINVEITQKQSNLKIIPGLQEAINQIKEDQLRAIPKLQETINQIKEDQLKVIPELQETINQIQGLIYKKGQTLKEVLTLKFENEMALLGVYLKKTKKEIMHHQQNQFQMISQSQETINTLREVIHQKEREIKSMFEIHRYKKLTERLRDLQNNIKMKFRPRLGVLFHYPPRNIAIPNYYCKIKSLKKAPLISIVTPSFNQGSFIERTIKSVLDQKYPNLEYVIQDGGSTDETPTIVAQYATSLARWESTKDEGQSHAINLGFRQTKGEIMAYLNSDDLILPGTLNYVANFFAKNPRADVVYGHRILIDEADQEIGRWVLPPHENEILSWVDFVPQETLFWRRRIWEKVGGAIDEGFRFAMDWDLILRFREAGAQFYRLPRFLGAFRIHPHQKTSAEMSNVGVREMELLRSRYLGRPVSHEEITDNIRLYMKKHILYHKLYKLRLLRY